MTSALEIKQLFISKVNSVNDLNSLEQLRIEFFGKRGFISEALYMLSKVPNEQKKELGAKVNEVKDYILSELENKKALLENAALEQKIYSEALDITLPPRPYHLGVSHPISRTINDLKDIFFAMGFESAEGPSIETQWNNFSALNIAEHHPARQSHDTFYLDHKDEEGKPLLLRTHTSPVQIRHMLKNKPPIKIISIGKTYRSDDDATHTPMFHQIEGLYIDKHVNLGHLKSCLEEFLAKFFGLEELPIRLRPSYFPFTEPSVEVDVRCDRSNKDEIKIGAGDNWLEILGAGMVHPKVLQNVGIDPEEYQGFAFGCGIERLSMLKYNISDLREFYENDLRWVRYYGF